MDWFVFDADEIGYFSLAMSRELRLCPGVGGRKCVAFLSSLDRGLHPTCTRCRGWVCTEDLTCDIYVDWSSAQWEAFAKKRSFAECKRSARPSGSFLPPAPKTSSCARTSSEVAHSSCFRSSLFFFLSPSLQKGGIRGGGGSRDAPCAASHGASPIPLNVCPARGVEVPLDARPVCASGLLSSMLLRGLRIWEQLARSGLLLLALPLPRLPLPHSSLHALRGDESRESSSEVRSRP